MRDVYAVMRLDMQKKPEMMQLLTQFALGHGMDVQFTHAIVTGEQAERAASTHTNHSSSPHPCEGAEGEGATATAHSHTTSQPIDLAMLNADILLDVKVNCEPTAANTEEQLNGNHNMSKVPVPSTPTDVSLNLKKEVSFQADTPALIDLADSDDEMPLDTFADDDFINVSKRVRDVKGEKGDVGVAKAVGKKARRTVPCKKCSAEVRSPPFDRLSHAITRHSKLRPFHCTFNHCKYSYGLKTQVVSHVKRVHAIENTVFAKAYVVSNMHEVQGEVDSLLAECFD